MVTDRVAKLNRENQILRKESEQYQRAFEVAIEQNQKSATPSSNNLVSPHSGLNTGTES